MIPENTYCAYALSQPEGDLHRKYHDEEYGFPLKDDNALFGRLILEINQAGLSWSTILKKKENFHAAYSAFEVSVVANYGEADRQRLLNNAGIIRNRLKVDAAIHNAGVLQGIQKEFGSFYQWLCHQHPLVKKEWVRLFKKTFRFTGGEITGEFLMSIGFLEGAHHPNCPVFKEIAVKSPAWMDK